MALSKERKNELVAQYIEQLERGQGIILADYKGLDVSEMSKGDQEPPAGAGLEGGRGIVTR